MKNLQRGSYIIETVYEQLWRTTCFEGPFLMQCRSKYILLLGDVKPPKVGKQDLNPLTISMERSALPIVAFF
jgi:hypothetical protein